MDVKEPILDVYFDFKEYKGEPKILCGYVLMEEDDEIDSGSKEYDLSKRKKRDEEMLKLNKKHKKANNFHYGLSSMLEALVNIDKHIEDEGYTGINLKNQNEFIMNLVFVKNIDEIDDTYKLIVNNIKKVLISLQDKHNLNIYYSLLDKSENVAKKALDKKIKAVMKTKENKRLVNNLSFEIEYMEKSNDGEGYAMLDSMNGYD